MNCPLCGVALVPVASVQRAHDPGGSPHSRLPTLLALPLHEVETEQSPGLALWAICDLVEVTLRLLVMLGVAEQLRQQARLPDALSRELRDHIEWPTLGKWLVMALAVARHTPSTPDLELTDTVASTERLLGGRSATPDTGLLALRNRLAHGGPVSRFEAERLFALWKPRVRDWVDNSLGWMTRSALLAVDDRGRRFLLRGLVGAELSQASEFAEAAMLPAEAVPGSLWFASGSSCLELGPLGAFELEGQHLLVYVRSSDVRLQYLRLLGEGGLCESATEARDRFRQIFLSNTSQSAPAERYSVPDFLSEIRRESSRRIGRARELANLTSLIRSMSHRLLWCAGPAGVGKSNLMASVSEAFVDHPPDNTIVLPYRFRAGDRRCGRAPFIEFVRERLDARWGPAASVSEDRDPISNLRRAVDRIPSESRLLLLIDGLDEVSGQDDSFVGDVISSLIAPRVTIVCAGRPERNLPQSMRRLGAHEAFPDGLPPMAEDDIRALLLERIGPGRKRLLARDVESEGTLRNRFIELVTQRSDGLPIYVNYAIGDLNSGRLSPEHPEQLPRSVNAYHEELLRRAAIGDLQAIATPVLCLLALAFEPLTVTEIASLMVRCGRLTNMRIELVERALLAIGSMVRKRAAEGADDRFMLFHHSLREHILESPELSETLSTLKEALARNAFSPGDDEASTYLYRFGVQHLLASGRASDALRLITDFDFLMARFQHLDPIERAAEGWLDDWERVRHQVGALEGDAQEWWRFAHENRHNFLRPDWESWRVLFQAAMDRADESVVTLAAERYEESGKRDWAWLRWLNRPKRPLVTNCVAVMMGGSPSWDGVLALPSGRVLSWGRSTLAIWEPLKSRLIKFKEVEERIDGVALLPDGRILSWHHGKCLRLWNRDTLESLSVAPILEDFRERDDLLEGYIVLQSPYMDLYVWDADTEELVVLIEPLLNQRARRMIVSRTRGILDWGGWYEGRDEGVLRWYDRKTLRPLETFEHSNVAVWGGIQLSNGNFLSWSIDFALMVWSGSGELIGRLDGHSARIKGALEIPNNRMISWSDDSTLRIWDLEMCEEIAVLSDQQAEVSGVEILPNGNLLSWSDDGTVRVWSRDTWEIVHRLDGYQSNLLDICILPDGRVISRGVDSTLWVWNPETSDAAVRLEGHSSFVKEVLALDEHNVVTCSDDGTLRLWDLSISADQPNEDIHRVGRIMAQITANGNILSLSHTGETTLFCGVTTRRIASWDGQPLDWRRPQKRRSRELSGNRLLTIETDGALCVWNLRDTSLIHRMEGHCGALWVNMLKDGRILSEGEDKTLRLWDCESGKALCTMSDEDADGASGLALSGNRILYWSKTSLRIWDGDSGAILASLDGHTDVVTGALEIRGNRILSWSRDLTIRIWDGETGRTIQTLLGHQHFIDGAIVLADGKIMSWSDGALRFWDADIGATVAVIEQAYFGDVHVTDLVNDYMLLSYLNVVSVLDIKERKLIHELEAEALSRPYFMNVSKLADGRITASTVEEVTRGPVRIWKPNTYELERDVKSHRDWEELDALAVEACLAERAQAHSLHVGCRASHARGELAVFDSDTWIRICRFIPSRR
jgi:WD40 repeat protein